MTKDTVRPMDWAEIEWMDERNNRIGVDLPTPGKLKELDFSLSHGYDRVKGGVCQITTPPPAELKKAIKHRQDEHDRLEKASAKGGDDLLLFEIFKHYKCDKNGKIIPPKFVGNMHFTRAGRMLWAALIAKKDGRALPEYELTVEVVPYQDLFELRRAQIDENVGKLTGNSPIGEASMLEMADMMMSRALPEIEFRKLFRDGTGQKLFRFFTLDRRFSHLNLYKRAVQGFNELYRQKVVNEGKKPLEREKVKINYTENGPIDLSVVNREVLAKFVLGEKAKLPSDWAYTNLDADDFEQYLDDAHSGIKKAPSMLPQKEIVTISGNRRNQVVADVLRDVANGKKTQFDVYDKPEVSRCFNLIRQAVQTGGDELIEDMYSALKAAWAKHYPGVTVKADGTAEEEETEEEETEAVVAHGKKKTAKKRSK
jgi:hypothetical protein